MAAKFEKILISPDFSINFRKSHQISRKYQKRSKSYGKKPLGVPKDPPGLNRVNTLYVYANARPQGHRPLLARPPGIFCCAKALGWAHILVQKLLGAQGDGN